MRIILLLLLLLLSLLAFYRPCLLANTRSDNKAGILLVHTTQIRLRIMHRILNYSFRDITLERKGLLSKSSRIGKKTLKFHTNAVFWCYM